MLGYSRNELLTMTPKDIDTEESARRIPEITKELLTKGHATFEMTSLAKDGRKIPVEINSLVFTLSGERVMLSITRDITERKKAEAVLKRRDAILQAVNFAAERFLTTPDLKHEVNHVLERLGQATGVDRVSLFENYIADNDTPLTSQRYEWTASGIRAEIDNPHLQNIAPREAGYGRWVEILGQGEPIFGHTRDFPPGEQALLVLTKVLSLAIVPIFVRKMWWGFINFGMCRVEHKWSAVELEALQTAANLLGTAIQRQQAEAEREQLITELEAKNAELERFTYSVSHDLKSPLVTINGFLGLLAEDVTKRDEERVQRDIEQIRDATQKMKRLLDDLLELSRIGRLINPPEVVELDELAHEAVALVAGQIAERGVQVVIASGLPVVYGDRPRLLEVLQNLVDNAVKFMGEQPVPRIEIGVRRTDTETICYVKDNGKGIEPRYHDKVFGLFERLDQTIEGTGIGLALVRRIVEVHSGRIWIESEGKGQGSTFCFTLP
jgi:signal transduction histidine kinase